MVSTGELASAVIVVAPGRRTSPRSASPTRQLTRTVTLPPARKSAVEVAAVQSAEAVWARASAAEAAAAAAEEER